MTEIRNLGAVRLEMAHSDRAVSSSSCNSPEAEPQLFHGDSNNPEDVDVTQDATQRKSTFQQDDRPSRASSSVRDPSSDPDDASERARSPDTDTAPKHNFAQIKDEPPNTQAKTHNVEADDLNGHQIATEAGKEVGARVEATSEPSQEAQEQLSERAQKLRDLSWDDLQQAFQEEMDKQTQTEEMLKHEFRQYTEVGPWRSLVSTTAKT